MRNLEKNIKSSKEVDVLIIGAGPVGLLSAYLGAISGLSVLAIDKSDGPLKVGRADALNARTLQLLETIGLFSDLYPLGKTCNTSSIFENGEFVSRQSKWWDEIEGCLHKHFLMLGQAHVEKLLDKKLKDIGRNVLRSSEIKDILISDDYCLTTLSNGEKIKSKYIIGADGSRSFVREHFKVPFELVRPQITWAVIDGIIDSDFPKVPEIIVFQNQTSDVAWIPREGEIDRFYIRMDKSEFTQAEVLEKINQAMHPYTLSFKEVEWFSQFSVKESVAESFHFNNRVFLAGDACHVHSVNGGQGLNTGLADAFNLMWKISKVIKEKAPQSLLKSYETERKPVAQSVIESSGELVRSTKFSQNGTHAKDYINIVEKRAGNITGMGIRYGEEGLIGSRVFDFKINEKEMKTRLYSKLDYTKHTLLIATDREINIQIPNELNVIKVSNISSPYKDQAILIRPDAYIKAVSSIENIANLVTMVST